MNIIEFTDKFQKIEIENKFFEVKNSDGLLYWDIVRHDVFYLLYYELSNITSNTVKVERNWLSFFKNVIVSVFGFIRFTFKLNFNKYKYVFLIASRNKDKEGNNIDLACNDALRLVHKESFIIETFQDKNYTQKYNSISNFGLLFECRRVVIF